MADNVTVPSAEGNVDIRTTEISSGLHAHVMFAGEHIRVYDGVQSIGDSTSSQSLTVPSGATHAAIYCESAADTDTDYVRYWEHATAPTASVGKKLKNHEEIGSAAPASFRFIRGSGSATCTLRVTYYHYA
jgi:hypothetical protein